MSRKHFNAIAWLINEYVVDAELTENKQQRVLLEQLSTDLARVLCQFNTNFATCKFVDACMGDVQ